MPIRIPWDEQEAAILISACEDYNLGKISKKAAIEAVSKKLRQRAINRGLTIDSIFRNENGITMQFMLINELITNEKSGLRGASKLFVRMVEMYKNDTDEFEKILKEAREMCNQSINIRDLFSKWLSEQFSPAQVSEIFITYYDIDEDLRNEGVLETSLLEITRLDIIEEILNKLQISHRYSPKYVKAVKLYRDWLLHNEQFLSDDMEDAEPENKEEKYSAVNIENVIDDSNEEDIGLTYVDYKNKGFYKNTQVIFFEYFGTREYGIETWSNLYEKVYQCLLDDYPHILNGQMSKAIGYSADAIVNKVGQLLKMCNIDAENLVIAYKYKNDGAIAVLHEHNTNINVSKENDIEQLEGEDNKHKFLMWLNKKGFKNSDVMLMKFDMSRMSKMAIAQGITEKELFDVESMDSLKMIGYRLQRTSDFLRLDTRLQKQYKRTLEKYLEYLVSENVQINVFDDDTINPEQRKKEFIEWMLSNELSIGTARTYISSLGLIGNIARENGITQTDVFSISDIEILKKAYLYLMTNQEFIEKNEARHNQFRAAWGKYIQFSGDESFDTTSVKLETSNVDGKKENVALYMRLKSMASVYDDVHGYNIEWIKSMIGLPIDIEKLRTVLEDVSWITKVEEDVYSFSKNAKPFEKTIEFDKESFVSVLMLRYQSGMRFDSIDFDNFRETYAGIIGEEINFTDKELEICLRKCGVLYQGRVFPAEGIVNKSARERLMEYITSSFASGKQILYYESIYSDLTDVFAYCFNLTDAMMLKPYLEYVCEPDEYYFAEEYMTKDKNVKIDHSSEIEDFLLSMGKPLSYDEIYAGLSHISKEIIYNEIKSNPNIVLNERGHYYHYGIFEFTSEDADRISGFIGEDIEEEGYCIWSRVFVKIQKNMPLFIENNAYLSSIGIRNAVSKKLSGRFNFDGEVICNLGQFLSMTAVYRLYGEHKAPFSDDDIYKFSKEVSGGVIYFDSLSETVVRTSRKQFVNKNDVKFDVEEIDNALSTYLSTGFLFIKDIDSFLVFPNVGYEWNAFLLESYLMYYSSKYTLLNNGRSLNNVAGALVRKGSGYDDFVEVCADVLANSDCVLTKQKALDYLADQNLLTRRSYSRIDSAIIKAKQIRNKEG